MLITAAAKNSIDSRCGHVMTVSSGSFWTRTTASCLTSARSRYGLAAIGTRCLSISVVRRSGGAAGSVLRRWGASAGAASGGAAGSWLRSRGSVMSALPSLQRAADAAVLPDAPEVDGQEDGRHEGHQDDVQDVEAEQRVLADLDAAEEEQLAGRVEDRGVRGHVAADR